MKRIFIPLLCLLAATCLFGQSIQLEDIEGSKFKGVFPIISEQDEAVSGYYTYYMLEKEDKGMRTFEFSIINKEISNVVKAKITIHKNADINNTVFNGKYFLISVDDVKNMKTDLYVLDLTGKIVKQNTISYEKKKLTSSNVYPAANGEGFYVVTPIKEKAKIGFSIEKMNNNLEKTWNIEETSPKGFSNVADLINNQDRFVIWKEHGLGLKTIKPTIVCYNAKTGEKIFERDGFDGTSTILYNQLRIDKDGSLLLGGGYVDGQLYKSNNNTGIYVLKLSKEGKEILYTKVNNKEQIQSVLKSTSKGFTLGSKDKVWVEDLIVEGNDIVVVSEMFRENMNMNPAQSVVDLVTGRFVGDMSYRDSNNRSPKKTFQVMDFMLFKFNQKGDLGEIKPILKEDYTKVTVYYPYVNYAGMDLAKIMERLGWFDYGFSTYGKNNDRYMVCSNNAESRKPQVFIYSLQGDYAQKKINLKQESKINLEEGKVGYFKTLRNVDSKLVVVYYQRKLKRITVNLESIF